ncbi:MAG: NAD(P)H-dependent oxidoreductase [Ignavibacteriales bacterium]
MDSEGTPLLDAASIERGAVVKAFIVSDKEYQTPLFKQLRERVFSYLAGRGFEIEEIAIGRDDLMFCKGCFGCWVKKPGECTINDQIGQINRNTMNSDVVIYLCPVVFGQFSANIKNVIDRWLPNVLPFFMTRKNGSTMHPFRYKSYPRQIMAAYADDLSPEDANIFMDIKKKHLEWFELLMYEGSDISVERFLDGVKLQRMEVLPW